MTTGPVGIVGAGPVGLITALRLAGAGVSSVLLDAKPELVRQGSKACLVQGDVLEILDRAGCAAPIAHEGVTWTVARTYVRDRVIRSTRYPHGPGFGPFVNISQYRVEQVLAAAVGADPRCDLRWGHEVVAVEQDGGSVRVRVRTGAGAEHVLRFAYLVAADGVRSRVRELTGVEWTGYTHPDRFLITDIRAALPLAKERHFHYDPAVNRGRQMVLHPQPDDVWRIDWQLPPDADIDAERADGRFDARVRAVVGDVPYEVEWVSTYRFHQRVVRRFVVGRILFAGDAAHALPPYGSRGMNSGIQDADNLAWKLAAVLSGRSGDALLASYHSERHAAARENLRVTEATIRFMVPPGRLRRWTRAALLALAHTAAPARDRIDSGRMAEPYTYTDSPVVAPQNGNPLLGSFAPDGPVRVDGRPGRLRKLLPDNGFGVLCVASDAARAAALLDTVGAVDGHAVPVGVTVLVPHTVHDATVPAGVTLAHADADLLHRYGRGWWLVRPDGHLAAHDPAPHDPAPHDPAPGDPAPDPAPGGPERFRAAVRRALGHVRTPAVKESRP